MANPKEPPALGIDLGTTCSLVCVLREGQDRPEIIRPDPAYADDLLPSVFCNTDRNPVVGIPAVDMLRTQNRKHVVRCPKRYLRLEGKRFRSGGKPYTPKEISTFFLKQLRAAAARALGTPPQDLVRAVVTVPAYFGRVERRLTREAAEGAGFGEVHLLDEPIAAAIGLGLHDQPGTRLVMVLDLGGGTFDVTLLKVGLDVRGGFYELGRGGDSRLGGLDWDKEIAELVASRTKDDDKITNEFLDENNIFLFEACEKAKKDFCEGYDELKVTYEDRDEGQVKQASVTRREFLQQTKYLTDYCARVCDQLLADIPSVELKWLGKKRVGWADIDQVYMVGGGSRMPAVQDIIEQRWGRPATLAPQPQHAVAYGAAVRAAAFANNSAIPIRLRSPHTTGIWVYQESIAEEPKFFPIVRRNSPLPGKFPSEFPVGGRGSKLVINIVEERITRWEDDGYEYGEVATVEMEDLNSPNPDDVLVVTFDSQEPGEIDFHAKFGKNEIARTLTERHFLKANGRKLSS